VNIRPNPSVIDADDLWTSNLHSLRLEELVDASRTPDPWPPGLPGPTPSEASLLPRAFSVVCQVDEVVVSVVLRSATQVSQAAQRLDSAVGDSPALASLAARRLRRLMQSPWLAGPSHDPTPTPAVKAAVDVLLTRLDTLRCLQVGPGRSVASIDTPKAGTGCGAVASGPLLSARELQVARLVSLGMTNKQVAIQLTLSPNTIKRHVARILRRLGLSKRSAMAAWYATTSQSEPGTVAPAVGTHLPWLSTPARMAAHVLVDPLRIATATLQQ